MSHADLSSIRQQVVEKRKNLRPEQVRDLSAEVIERFTKTCEMEGGLSSLRVGLYRALPSELDLVMLETWLRLHKNRIFFPRVRDRLEKAIEFAEVPESSKLSWKMGPYGIQEPHPELVSIGPAELDIIFVPGLAFGMSGERVGTGVGYYDRYLSLTERALRVALGFDFQLFPKLFQNDWDQPVHWVVTEKREYRSREALDWRAFLGTNSDRL